MHYFFFCKVDYDCVIPSEIIVSQTAESKEVYFWLAIFFTTHFINGIRPRICHQNKPCNGGRKTEGIHLQSTTSFVYKLFQLA